MKIKILAGYHNRELLEEVARAWRGEQLLIVVPPLLKDRSFVTHLESVRDWPDQPVLGVFTSGTLSAKPRLVLYSKKNLESALNGIHSLFDESRIQHVFCYPQPYHTFGLTLGYLSAIVRGWWLHTPPGKYGRDSHRARLSLRERNVLTLGTPTHFYDLLTFSRSEKMACTPSYSCIIGGATVLPKLWMDVQRDLKIESPSVGYGCTEASPGITHLAPGLIPAFEGEIGRPLPSLNSSLSTRGVCIQGPGLCLAILQGGKLEFPKRLWIRDQVRIGVNRSWQFLGRLDLTLNRGGMKFSLEAIERDLASTLGLSVIASAVRDPRLGEDLALAVLASGAGLKGSGSDRFDNQIGGPETQKVLNSDIASGIANFLNERWSLRIEPARIRIVDEFPLNECAKIDRQKVRDWFRDPRSAAVASGAAVADEFEAEISLRSARRPGAATTMRTARAPGAATTMTTARAPEAATTITTVRAPEAATPTTTSSAPDTEGILPL